VKAYVLVQTGGAARSIAPELKAIPGVLSADDLGGAYDAIALAEAPSTRHLMEDVVARVLELPAVTRALPAPVIPSMIRRPPLEGSDELSGPRGEAA
jgi:hypothetical protein